MIQYCFKLFVTFHQYAALKSVMTITSCYLFYLSYSTLKSHLLTYVYVPFQIVTLLVVQICLANPKREKIEIDIEKPDSHPPRGIKFHQDLGWIYHYEQGHWYHPGSSWKWHPSHGWKEHIEIVKVIEEEDDDDR